MEEIKAGRGNNRGNTVFSRLEDLLYRGNERSSTTAIKEREKHSEVKRRVRVALTYTGLLLALGAVNSLLSIMKQSDSEGQDDLSVYA